LERKLYNGGTADDDTNAGDGIDDVTWSANAVYIKFSKVWEATGCELALHGSNKLFDGKAVRVKRVLDNDLPYELKMSEARKRDANLATKKAAKGAKATSS